MRAPIFSHGARILSRNLQRNEPYLRRRPYCFFAISASRKCKTTQSLGKLYGSSNRSAQKRFLSRG